MKHATPLPTGTVTFLFTDIEGSTKRWEQHPRVMEAALARHDALAAALLAEHHGTLVKHRGEGDSLFAVFALAADAVAAAAVLQQALCREPWPAETPLRVRMALHTGDAAVPICRWLDRQTVVRAFARAWAEEMADAKQAYEHAREAYRRIIEECGTD